MNLFKVIAWLSRLFFRTAREVDAPGVELNRILSFEDVPEAVQVEQRPAFRKLTRLEREVKANQRDAHEDRPLMVISRYLYRRSCSWPSQHDRSAAL